MFNASKSCGVMIAYFFLPEMHDVLNETKTIVLEDVRVPTITEPDLCVNRDCLQNGEALNLSKVKRASKSATRVIFSMYLSLALEVSFASHGESPEQVAFQFLLNLFIC